MSDANRELIAATRAKFPGLFKEGKFDELGEVFYAEDAVAMPAGREPIRGRTSICQYFRDAWESTGLWFEFPEIEVHASEDIGYVTSRYIAHTSDGGAVPGVTHEAFKPQADGTWKCVVDMWHAVE